MQATNDAVIGAYEKKIGELDKTKARLTENLEYQAPSSDRYEKILEISLRFLSSPWKIWEIGQIVLRRTLLRLAFTEGFSYHRNDGARTPKISLPFKALGALQYSKTHCGAAGETRTLTGLTPQRPQRCASTIPPQPQC